MKTSALFLLVTVFIMSLGSSLLGGSLVWHLTRKYYYFWVTELGVELASCVMLIAGSLLCFPCSWIAFIVVQRPKPLTYMTLMILLSGGIFLFATGLMTSVGLSRSITPSALKAGMYKALQTSVDDSKRRSWFGILQYELKCCGVLSYTEWFHFRPSLPLSCCANNRADGQWRSCTESRMYRQSCLKPAMEDLAEFVSTTVTYASGLIVTMAFALFVVAYMLVTELEEDSRKLQVVRAAPLSQVYHIAPTAPQTQPYQPAPPYRASVTQLL